MAYTTYIVGFEIKSDNTYSTRYNSLMKLLNAIPLGWKEPTSFVAVHVDETLSGLASRLYVKSEISSAKDILIVVDTNTNKAKYYGPENRKPGKYPFDLI